MVRIPLHLVSPLVTSRGVHSQRVASLIEVTLDDGTIGWGEDVAPEGDFYTGESAVASLAALRDSLAAELGSMSWDHPSEIDQLWRTRDYPMARCALESAVWDAWAQRTGVSLAAAIGGGSVRVRVNAVIGLHDTPASAVAEAMARVDEGYQSLKLKIAPGRDRDVVAAIADAVGESIGLGVDANGAYGSDDVDFLASLSDVGVSLIEQPFAPDDLSASAQLVATGAIAVGLDESIVTIDELQVAADRGALTAVNIKPARVGGVAAACAMVGLAKSLSLDVWVGGMLESGIGRAMALAICGLDGVTLPADLSASSRYFDRDLCEPFVLSNGALDIPQSKGIGRKPDIDGADVDIEFLYDRGTH